MKTREGSASRAATATRTAGARPASGTAKKRASKRGKLNTEVKVHDSDQNSAPAEKCPSPEDCTDQAELLKRVIPADFTQSHCLQEPTEAGFSLAQTVCSYGYFSLAPNVWLPAQEAEPEDKGVFCRPLACPPAAADRRRMISRFFQKAQEQPDTRQTVYAVVTQVKSQSCVNIDIRSRHALQKGTEESVRLAIRRILRLDQNLDAWFACHAEAKLRGFGRTYRSPTVFEDMVKTITNCNVRFQGTIEMNRLLCQQFGADGAAFPDPWDLCFVSEDELQKRTRVGYRAGRIVKLAVAFVQRELTEEWFDDMDVPHAEVYQKLLSLYGFGRFAASNVMQLLGRYDPVVEAWDTETVRLMKELGIKGKSAKDFNQAARERYAHYHPYQFLAYWFELWLNYEARAGRMSTRWSGKLFDKIL